MKRPPSNPEFARFTDAMRQIMTVPKTAIQTKKREPKAPASSSASASPVPPVSPKRVN